MKVKVSARLVNLERRVLRNGCGELIVAAEARKLKVSTAAARGGLPVEEQKSVVAAGAKEVAGKVRELRGGFNFSEGDFTDLFPRTPFWCVLAQGSSRRLIGLGITRRPLFGRSGACLC